MKRMDKLVIYEKPCCEVFEITLEEKILVVSGWGEEGEAGMDPVFDDLLGL